MIEIWQPRWKDRVVLIATHKVAMGTNKIIFTKAPTLKGVYVMKGQEIMKYPIESNGRIDCYAVKLADLKQEGEV